MKLFVSLAIAAGICGVLILTGFLEFDPKLNKTETQARRTSAPKTEFLSEVDEAEKPKNQTLEKDNQLAQNEIRKKEAHSESVATGSGVKPETDKKRADIQKTITSTATNAQGTQNNQSKTGFITDKQISSGRAAKTTYAVIDKDIHQRSLSYLYFLAKDSAGSAERRFYRFLKTEFDLDEQSIGEILQMTFWKNFLVFQKKWSPSNTKAFEQAFEREVELKKAGFEAKGILLMNAEINAAKSRLSEEQQRLAQRAGGKTSSAEVTP